MEIKTGVNEKYARNFSAAAVALLLTGAHLFAGSRGAAEGAVITGWMEQALQTVRTENIGTPGAGRLYAMVSIAIYDAVNGIDVVRRHGREHAMVPATGAPVNGSRAAAAAAAASTVLTAAAPARKSAFDGALASELSAFEAADKGSVAAGRSWGEYVGQQVIARRSADGTQSPLMMHPGSGAGEHRSAFDARWRNMTAFGIASKAPYGSLPPPPISSAAYAAAFGDVKTLGAQDCDPVRNEIAEFWLAEGGTPRETGIWFQAAIAIAQQQGSVRSISETARLFALLGMAIADAVTVSWETKATYFSWRPAVAIPEAGADGNPQTDPDPVWRSRFGLAGGSPEYNSGTSTFGGAASQVLELFFGRPNLAFCFESDGASNGPRCYDGPLQAAVEAGRSRIFQGIHFQFSNEDGRRVGRALGKEIAMNRLTPLRETR